MNKTGTTIELDPEQAKAFMEMAAKEGGGEEEEDAKQTPGMLLPSDGSVALSPQLIADEMLSRASTSGPAAAEYVMEHLRHSQVREMRKALRRLGI